MVIALLKILTVFTLRIAQKCLNGHETLWNLKPNQIRDNEHYCNKLLFRKATKITFFQPSSKKVNFHWRFIRWRSRQRKNLIANFYDAVNSRFRIYKLLFQRKRKKKKEQKSGKIWAHDGKNSCFASVFSQLDYI